MRRNLILGFGLAGVLSGSPAVAQFPVQQAPGATPQPATPLPFGGAQPAPVGGGQPVGLPSAPMTPAAPVARPPGGGYVAPVGGFQPPAATPAPANGFQPTATPQPTLRQPAPLDIPLALGPNHPLAVKPEDGAYFICVKSYSRPSRPDPLDQGLPARQLAEGLAQDVQQAHRDWRVFLYEYVSEEKLAEARSRAAAVERANEFSRSLQGLREKSQLQGMQFLEPDHRLQYQTFKHRDQIAVLVGGFRTEDEAVKALAAVKKWPAPRDNRLMDGQANYNPGTDGKGAVAYLINPYAYAMVVPNPSAPRPTNKTASLDPFLVRLNEGRPYSLLTATKPWTLGVKSFDAPVVIQTQNQTTSPLRKPGLAKSADILEAGAEQAEMLAKALREMRGAHGEPLNLEAFVLHTRNGSFVTVGQFDSPNDPALLEKHRILSNLTFNFTKDAQGRQIEGTGQKLFGDQILPVKVPKP